MSTDKKQYIHNLKIPGWANKEILKVLGKYSSEVPEHGTIIELGGLFGRSTYTIGKNKKDSVSLITIDIWPAFELDVIGPVEQWGGGSEEMAILNKKLDKHPATFAPGDLFELWKEYTKDIVNLQGVQSNTNINNDSFPIIDLIYHDAAHDYQGVYNDLVHWFPKLKEDGIMIIDDYEPTYPEVVQAVDQYVKEHNLETIMVTWRNILIKRKKMKKIGFIGVGKLGQACAEEMVDAGHSVEGYDLYERSPRNFKMKTSIAETIKDKNLIFIAVPTQHDPMYGGETPTAHLPTKDFDYNVVKNILTEVNKYVNKSQLVVLISTVLPGTTRREFVNLINNGRFIYNPYLIAMGSIAWDMTNPEMVIIGTEDGSLTGDAKELIDFYKTIMQNNPRYEVGTWDEAEAIKVFYNTFISTKIGLCNMVQDVAERLGNINVDIVTSALAKSTQRIMGPKYMIAGGPDGGSCHPRDNIALRYMAEQLELNYDLFGAIMHAREIQTKNIATKVLQEAGDMPIVIVGKAFKPGVVFLEGSGSLLVAHYINEAGKNYYYLDKYTNDMPPSDVIVGPCTYLLMHDATITYCDSPLKETVTKQEISPAVGSVIIDIWRKQADIPGCKVIHYGNTRK